MKMLIQLATGSQLIPDGESRVLAMVHYLKVSSLLLDCGVDYITKVHDIIRDVARSIASTDSKYALLQVTCNSGYFPSDASYCTGKFLRLDAETDDVHFKEREVCPDLHTLWLQCNNHPQQFSGGFYKMFVNLNFLMLQKVNISLKQFSLQPLDNLGTLTLSRCDTRKTDGSLFPKSLKTLCIWYCDLPRPLDVANLKYLRKLEIQQKREPELVMALNVISTLSSLEELHIPNGFIIDREEYHTEPIVMEICELTHLASLQFHFYADHTFRVKNVFSELDRYSICVGAPKDIDLSERYWRVSAMRSTRLYGHHSQSWEGLMTRAEEVRLRYSNVEVSSICNGQRRAFEDLNKLYIENYDMEHLASISCISHDEIQYSLRPATCFSKLTILKISYCSEMKYLFCNKIAKNLGQLQELTVNDCKSMEAIILNEGTSNREVINFSKLKLLKILFLSRLKSFYVRKKYMISGSTLSTDLPAEYQYLFDGHVAFPSLKELTIQSLPNSSVIWGKDCYNDNGSSFCKLNNLSVSGCDKLESLIPQAMLHRLNNLEHIEVCDCRSMRRMFPPCVANDLRKLQKMSVKICLEMIEIIGGGEEAITDGILFPELMVLELDWLPSLTSFWCYQSRKADTCKVAYSLLRLSSVFVKDLPNLKSFFHGANFEFHMPALEKVEVCNCGLSDLFTFSMFRKFQLKSLLVNSCHLLENLVEDSRGDETCDNIITLFQLTSVDFQNLPKLRSAFHNANYEFHMPVLTNVFIRTCGFSDTLFNLSVIRNLKQLKTLEVSFCSSLEGLYEDVRGDEHSDSGDQIITLPQLSSLLLENLPSLKSIFYSVNYECKMPALMKLKVVNCGISTLFTWSICRELQQLKKLVVVNCWLLKHIVENEKCDEIGDINDILFPELKILALLNLPSLTDFWCYQRGKTNICKVAFTLLQLSAIVHNYLPDLESFFHGANFEFHMPVLKKVIVRDSGLSSTLFTRSVFKNLKQLEYLKVSDCKLLEGIFEDNETTDRSENIITLDRVSTVHLQGLPNLKSIFYGATYECYMPGLKKVKIVGCGPSILFTCSVFREIPRLQELHVSDCGLLEHVVEEAGSDQTSETNGKSIRSSKLSSITLESLPNLRSFSCTSSYVLNILKLQNLRVIKCPRMEYFSSSTTTSLVNLAIDWYCEEGFQDLNDFIRQYHKSGSCLSYCSEETSYRIQDLGTQSEIIIEEEEEDEEEEEEEELLESETETEIGTETEGGSETDSSG